MADFTKHREETLKVNVDFSSALNDGDSVDSIDAVTVQWKVAGVWTDVSDEFGSPSGSKSGDTVDVTLGAGSSAQQEAGDYRVRVDVNTANGELLVLTPTLEITDVADPNAP